jgi:hypothetical protein
MLAQGVQGDVTQVDPVELKRALGRVVEAQQQPREGGLAGAAWPRDGDDLAGSDRQG